MTGYSLIKLMNFIFILYNQFEPSFSQYNLYFTEKNSMMNTADHDCLYDELDSLRHDKEGLVSYCIRQETVHDFDGKDKLCHGKEITFQELKTNNVSIVDLFHWNAVMDIIDLYEKHLLSPNLVNHDEVYCNCSFLSRFGKFCQYDIDQDYDRRIFGEILYLHDNIDPDEKELNTHFTCYIGIVCQTNLFCLDWRQICNGIVDCDRGEDEPAELCLQMESNECDAEKEFRCKTGLCLPISLAYDAKENCPDRSNKIKMFDLCLEYPSLTCDEINHGWKQFSCNNGQYISYSDLTSQSSQTCINNRHLMYFKRLFSTTNEDQCWQALICLTGFDYLYSHINCSSEETIERDINVYCPNEFYFPSNSIVYSFVFFFYEKVNRHNWLTYSGPNYICYKSEYCPNHTWILSTISKNDFVCFHVDQRVFTWKTFYEYVLHIFSSCYIPSLTVNINDKILYKCNLSQTLISIYRVKDKNRDCFFNEDESEDIDLCLLQTHDLFQCFTNNSQCIRRSFLNDAQYDCSDGSDEYFEVHPLQLCKNSICERHPWKKRTPAEIYRFTELCDHIVNYHLFTKESNETDETDCEHWGYSCDSVYTNCDQIWNCRDGHDEINCSVLSYNDAIRSAFHCKINEHYCLQLMADNRINMTCIHINRVHDDIIDCIGGTDERLTNICSDKYPIDYKRRFHCMNSSECIRPDEVCDRKIDCPFADDERICPWLFQSNASTFYCDDAPDREITRCDRWEFNNRQCLMKEQFWFCDLEMISSKTDKSSFVSYETYPPEENDDTNQLIISTSEKRKRSLMKITTNDKWLCNFGFRIQSSILSNRSYCFCPPTYYGDYCQYQSEHLVVILKTKIRYFMNRSIAFRLVVYLLNENNFIISHDEIVFNHILSFDLVRFYLMYERVKQQSSLYKRTESKFVRIDSYIINETDVQYISSWKFPVLFPFLPVNKLVAEISLVDQSFRVFNCQKRCGIHGKCMYYLNSRDKEYCWCDQSWFGETCQMKSSLINLCAPHAQYAILNNKTKCICPLGRSGSQCYITHNSCANVQCKNNGTCLPLKYPNVKSNCVCQTGYKEPDCEFFSSPSNIFIGANLSDVSLMLAIISIFSSVMKNILIQDSRYLYDNITLPVTLAGTVMLPQFGFIRMFHNFSSNFYYAIIIHESVGLYPHTNTSVLSKNRCKNVSELFNETILYEYSYLKRLKLYHLPCHHDHDLRCFFDEYRMCICTREHKSSCFLFSHEYNNCNYCKNNGICLRSDIDNDYWKFVCICQECSFGNLCQFSLGNYYITFDILVGIDIKTGDISFNKQSSIIHVTLAILILILILSLICNTISIIVLSNKNIRQVGCDIYLLNLTIISQIGLIFLFLRYLYMIFIQTYIIDNQSFIEISCIVLEYSVRLIPSLFDWLTVCISIERTYTIMKDVHFTRITAAKTLKLARWIILIVVLVNILTTLHRPFYLILVDEIGFTGEPQGHPWCFLDLQSTSWNIYEKVINLCHLIIPLVFNIASLVFFISRKTQSELTSTVRKDKRTRFSILIEQLMKYKPLLMSTTIIVLLEIPRFILIFTLSCFKQTWQRYVYLAGYLLSFLPLCSILFIYILPSPKHKQQLKIVLKKMFRLNFFQET